MNRSRWMLLIALLGCGQDPLAGPGEGRLALWSEHWDNGRVRLEYQYYLDAKGRIVRHGWYREYSRFVDRMVTVAGRYETGRPVGAWQRGCRSTPDPAVDINGDFEFGDFTEWGVEGAREGSIGLVGADDERGGRFVARLTLWPGDITRNGNRVELLRLDPQTYQQERFYSWRFKVDEAYKDEDYWHMFCQFHNQPDFPKGEDWDSYPIYHPPLVIRYRHGEGEVVLYTTEQIPIELGSFPVRKGQWFDVYFQVKWSLEDDGYVAAFVDDRPVTPFNGVDYKFHAPTVYNEVGNYLKIGLYRDQRAVETNTVYVDNLVIGGC